MTDAERYRQMMEQEEPPAHLQDDVLLRVAQLRREEASRDKTPFRATRPSVTRRSHTTARRQPVPLLAKLGAGLAAACLVIGAILVAPVLTSHTQYSSLADTFGLALYANADEPGQAVAIATDESGIVPHGGMGGFNVLTILYAVNLTTVGDNIETVTYKLDGEDVCFEVYSLRKTDVGTWAHDKAELSQEFTVDYHNQHPEDSFPLINVNVAPPEERASQERRSELHDRAENADADERAAIDEELRALEAEDIARDQANWAQFENPSEREKASTKNLFYAEVDAAHKLEQATLIVQATFSDGSAAEKRYRIAPIDDFEWTLLKRWEAQGQPEDDPRLTAPLFTITELD
ncbi:MULTISPECIES: hypothetical protein [Gordonibacter]|uniref:DUF4179 domain-containing protein n=1 Tax=Gordonibacter faecis TaxID=3047475 RepID=A0ABT7DMF7_9ACTN|nr:MULTISPECIES: hypothetical protein [unclassified Gordonibacter]MDJ1650729.1 hypothetical protein [Gordonibacter sp. KGMB12511]HIW77239.1 hypothetical protein [Candidatus Gordonibacter avicola]